MTDAVATPRLTKFTILQKGSSTPGAGAENFDPIDAWMEVGVVEARERDHALRVFFADTKSDVDGEFVAVTEAGWNPKTVTIKLTPEIKIA